MKISLLPSRIKAMRRYRAICGVLIKYGFEEILERLRAEGVPGLPRQLFIRRGAGTLTHMTTQQRLRLAIEELGPTFIKLGQMLSTRPDLVPIEYIEELRKLQDNVSPFSSAEGRRIVADELGKPVNDLFLSFEDQPIAAASIAQVHRAVTLSGVEVVVKIQRPDIRTTIDSDMGILSDLAALLARRLPENEFWDPVAIVDEFKSWIMKELDFMQEGRNIDRFRHNFKHSTTVTAPAVVWEHSSNRVLTMEYVDGAPVLDLAELERRGLDRKVIARNGGNAVLTQIFVHGFFHGDPHPGNIRVKEGNIIVCLDFGLMGRIDDELMCQIGNLLIGVVDRDIARVERVLLNMQAEDGHLGSRALRKELSDFIDRYYHVPLNCINTELVLHEMLELCNRNGLRLPRDVYLMIKALVVMEDIGRKLDPDFDMVSMAQPYARKIMMSKIRMKSLLRDASLLLEDMKALLNMLPENTRQILLKLRRGNLGINLNHQRLEELIKEIDRSSNRVSFSMIIAALIIGSSFFMQVDKGPKFYDLPVFGFLGYVLAGVLGVWLVIGIIRSGKL